MNNRYDLVIFDLDGTLLNTLDDLCFSGNTILSRHGYPTHELDAYRFFVGDGILTMVERMLPASVRVQPDEVQTIFSEFMAFYQIHKMDKTAPYAGIIPLLTALNERGVKAAVASNKVQEAMPELMRHYFPTVEFAAIFGKREGVPPKPHPDIVLDILKQTAVDPARALYVGDTAVDMQTAQGAGLQKVGVLWGFRTEAELRSAHADYIVTNPMDILPLL